eukprot:384069-Amphidinium_carterae.1
MQLSTIDRLPEPKQRTKDADLRVGVITYTTPSMMRVATMTPRAIGPDCSDTLPVNQGRLEVSDG